MFKKHFFKTKKFAVEKRQKFTPRVCYPSLFRKLLIFSQNLCHLLTFVILDRRKIHGGGCLDEFSFDVMKNEKTLRGCMNVNNPRQAGFTILEISSNAKLLSMNSWRSAFLKLNVIVNFLAIRFFLRFIHVKGNRKLFEASKLFLSM